MRRGLALLFRVDGGEQEALAAELDRLGLQVTSAADPGQAWLQLDRLAVALVVVDVSASDGLELVASLRRRLGPFAPPVIALTARDDEEVFARAFEAGAGDVIARPVVPSLLRVKVRQLACGAFERPRFGCIGQYEIVRELGRGGMGVVYLALRDGVKVALKALDVGSRPTTEDIVRFRREAEALRNLDAPNVPRLLEAGRSLDQFWVAMEYVAGTSVADCLRTRPLSELETAQLIDDVAAALCGVHAAGLVHRDVKPSNVILAVDGHAKLVDFGLAKGAKSDSLTAPQDLIGTAVYMAPEVLNEGRVTPAGDAYALGLTALEALLGHCPLRGTVREIATQLLRGQVPSAARLLPSTIDPLLVATIDGLLEPSPATRTTPAAAREVLAPLLAAAPTPAAA
jgi:serine/threonine protein kinase